MDRDEIMTFLPHRAPMLLVDEAVLDENDEVARGVYRVRGDEWFLQGHFPGNPVVPGVILCEIMAQSCCLLIKDELAGKTPYFTGMNKVRFKHMVRPGDEIHTEARITRKKGLYFITQSKATVNGELAVQAEFSFVLLEG